LNYRYLLSGLLLSLLGNLCHAQSICITNGEWPPYMGQDLPDYGPVSAIITEAFALEGIEVDWQFYPWARAMLAAEQGQCNGTAVWSSNPERRKAFYFSAPIILNNSQFLYLESKPLDWENMSDLAGLTLGGAIGYDYGDAFNEGERKGTFKVTRLRNETIGIRMLLANRLDAFPIDTVVGKALLQESFSAEERTSLRFHPRTLRTDPLFLLLTRSIDDNQAMLERFNRGLQKLHESGAYELYMSRIETP
jgi:polar amino acid transport system substrate-binding protein